MKALLFDYGAGNLHSLQRALQRHWTCSLGPTHTHTHPHPLSHFHTHTHHPL